jgi:hypothetical protein
VCVVAVCAVLAGCGDDTGTSRGPRTGGVRPDVAGTTAALANCGEWKRATPPQRRRTVEDLRGQLGASQEDTKAESVLSDERAYDVFQRACRQSYANELRLYKLYVRAAAFEPLRER